MTTKIINGKLILPDGIKQTNIYYKGSKIKAISDKYLPYDEIIDANGAFVSPGFIDLHLHGGAGYEFIDATKEAIKKAANIHALHGATTIYPTLSAYDNEMTAKALKTIMEHKEDQDIIPNIPGVHLEGPYFSKKQAGAQLPEYIRDPDKREYTDLFNCFRDIIKRWSYAPETNGSDAFLEFLLLNGIIPSAAHTDARFGEITKAYTAGCRLVTHLYSCTSTIIREEGFRIPGVVEAAYLYDDIDVEAIADGCHLPPELLRLIVKIKGCDHVCLVSDAIRYAGFSSSDNTSDNIPYIIEDGVAKLKNRSAFAGSIATADVLIKTAVKKAGFSIFDSVKMMTSVPARIMGLKNKGILSEGMDADIILFDDNINIQSVIVFGKKIF